MLKKFFSKYIGFILLAGTLFIGLISYKDYGIAWDEPLQREMGLVSYNYVFHGDDSLKHYSCNVYGVAFELPLVMIEKALDLKDSRDIFLMRHLVSHLFFLLGAFAFFLLIDYLYSNKLLAIIGFLLLVVNPLIYGHSFFNSKDIPFLSMFIICFLAIAIAFKKNNLKWYVILAIACALLTNIRIMGILFIGVVWVFFALDYIAAKQDKDIKKEIIHYLLVFTGTSFFTLFITWPYLYSNPGRNFMYAFRWMANAPWTGNTLFFGTTYKSTQIPLDYSIIWFCISNPVTYLLLGVVGIIYFSWRFIKTPKSFLFDKGLRNQLLFLFCFTQPLIVILVFHSVLFDTWRHLYFIYPPFILLGIFGLSCLLKTKARLVVPFILIAGIGYTGYYMFSSFPYEHIYFNEFVKRYSPEYLRKNFELDYWGVSYKQAFEYILKNDTAQTINVTVMGPLSKENALLLKPEERKRIHFTDTLAKATYVASFYRNHPEDYPFQNQQVFNIKVLNSTIMSVFKLK